MSYSVNKVVLVGRVGKAPEIRQSADGKKIVSFSLATSESYKDKNGERKERTDWHNVVIFNSGLAELADRYISKGSKVYVEGALQTRKYKDKSGIEKYTTEVVLSGYACNICLLDSAEKGKMEKDDSDGWDNTCAPAGNDLNDEIPW